MLLERDLIQSTGFRNVREGDRVTGFQLRVRMPSYRGMAASLIDGISVRVGDLVDVEADVPLWTFGGRTYTLAELWDVDGVRWPLEDAAIVTVPHEGGLPEGVHEVSIELRLRMSYIPEEHQPSTYRETRHITLSPEAVGGPFEYGVSLYSFMTDYGTVLDLETALAAVAVPQFGQGVGAAGEGPQRHVGADVDEVVDAHGDPVDERGGHAPVRRHAHPELEPGHPVALADIAESDGLDQVSLEKHRCFLSARVLLGCRRCGQATADALAPASARSCSAALRAPRTAIATLMRVGFMAVAVGMRALPPTTRWS